MLRKLRDLDPIVHLVLIICIILLFASIYNLQNKVKNLPSQVTVVKEQTPLPTNESVSQSQVAKMIAEAIAGVSGSPKIPVKETINTSTNTIPRTSYIPMGSTFSTFNKDWTNLADSDTYIDVENDYGKNAYITLQASLKVRDSNGQAYVRIFDVTHGIAVNGSELSTINNADFKVVGSEKLSFWKGRNLYRIQIKSLNGFEVTVSDAKIKVTY